MVLDPDVEREVREVIDSMPVQPKRVYLDQFPLHRPNGPHSLIRATYSPEDDEIALNTDYFESENKDKMLAGLAKDNENGWSFSTTHTDVIVHEYAHVIMNKQKDTMSRSADLFSATDHDLIQEKLGEYALTDHEEFAAEAFMISRKGGGDVTIDGWVDHIFTAEQKSTKHLAGTEDDHDQGDHAGSGGTAEIPSYMDYAHRHFADHKLSSLPKNVADNFSKILRDANVSPEFLIRMGEGITGFKLYDTHEAVTEQFNKIATNKMEVVAGFYEQNTGQVFVGGLNEDTPVDGGDRDGFTFAYGSLMHETGHALDWSRVDRPYVLNETNLKEHLSYSDEWRSAWRSEIAPQFAIIEDSVYTGEFADKITIPLSRYAKTNYSEGFAEFVRARLSGVELEEDFPKCVQFFKDKKIW